MPSHFEKRERPEFKNSITVKVELDGKAYEVELVQTKDRYYDLSYDDEFETVNFKYASVKDLEKGATYLVDHGYGDELLDKLCNKLPDDDELIKLFICGTYEDEIEVAGPGEPPED
jgi:hypothetical protein